MTLFEIPVAVRPEKESRTKQLTRRNNDQIANGVHPATHRALFIGTGESCGDCRFHVVHYWDKHYHKCEKHRLGLSHSTTSDIRVGWPACVLFEATG